MTDIRSMTSNSSSSLTVPIHQNKNVVISKSNLPPTPSTFSSVSSFGKVRDLSPKISDSQQKYGSLGSSTPYLESLSTIERPCTPSQTTINPNDDDEGLYLLWTQQLLREKGFTPSSCRPEFEDYENTSSRSASSLENDASNDDSSISDMSFSSSDDDDDMEDDDNDRYIAEQRRLLLSSPAPSAFQNDQPSLTSHYSTSNYAAEVAEDDHSTDAGLGDAPSQNSIYSFFKYLFPACF